MWLLRDLANLGLVQPYTRRVEPVSGETAFVESLTLFQRA